MTSGALVHMTKGPMSKWANPRDAQCLLLSPCTGDAPYQHRRKQIKTREGMLLLSFSAGFSMVASLEVLT
jgi:hypothetical protein